MLLFSQWNSEVKQWADEGILAAWDEKSWSSSSEELDRLHAHRTLGISVCLFWTCDHECNLIKHWLSCTCLLLCPPTHWTFSDTECGQITLLQFVWTLCVEQSSTLTGSCRFPQPFPKATSLPLPRGRRTTKYSESNQCISSARGPWHSNYFLAFLSAKPR